MIINFKSTPTKVITKDQFAEQKRELSEALSDAIGTRSLNQFVSDCEMVDNEFIKDLLYGNIQILPNKHILKIISNKSQGRVSYTYLCKICGYSELEVEDVIWKTYFFERGAVYYADFGQSNMDSEQNGKRPCVVVSNDKGNKNSTTLNVAPITSKYKHLLPSHVLLTCEDGMKEDSRICIEQTRCISKRRLFYNGYPIKILQLSDKKEAEVNVAIEKQFGLINVIYDEEMAFKFIEQINLLKKQNIIKDKKFDAIIDERIEALKSYCSKYHKNYRAVIEEYNMLNNYSFAI